MDRGLEQEVDELVMERLGEKVRLLEAKVVVLEAEKEERTSVKEKVERLERMIESHGGKVEKKVKMIEAKDMKPSTLKKNEDWKVWQEKTMRYGEAVHKGMEEVLKR